MTQSGYFKLATTGALGMGITDRKLLFCHGISERSVEKIISTRYYNNRMVYDYSNNTFPAYCGSPYFNLPPITIGDRSLLDKRARYTPDMLPDSIYVASENSVITFDTPSDSPQLLLLNYDYPNPLHPMKKY